MEDCGRAIELLKRAKRPVILAGGGVVWSDAVAEVKALSDMLNAPVAVTYLHNDA